MEGRPGDHPVTDMLYHGMTLVDDEIDALLKQVCACKNVVFVKRFFEQEIYHQDWSRDEIINRLKSFVTCEE